MKKLLFLGLISWPSWAQQPALSLDGAILLAMTRDFQKACNYL